MFQHGASTQVDRTTGGAGPGGGGSYQVASADGSVVFFTDADTAGLTANTVAGSGANLYAYNVAAGTLTDTTGGQSAAQVDGVVGSQRNGSYVYFVAEGALASGGDRGSGEPVRRARRHDHVRRDAQLPTTASDWNGSYTARVTPDGTHLAFESTQSLTGFDSTDAPRGHARQRGLPLRRRLAQPRVRLVQPDRSTTAGSLDDRSDRERPAHRWQHVPAAQPLRRRQQAVLRHGRRTSPSTTPTAPRTSTSCAGGAAHLISTGTSDDNSLFIDASANGNDVFFITREQLASRDDDGGYDLYDARVGGGFPESAPLPPCSADACRPGTTPAPPPPAQSTSTFSGPGNAKASSGAKPKKPTVKLSAKALTGFRFSLTFKPSTQRPGHGLGSRPEVAEEVGQGWPQLQADGRPDPQERSALHKKHKRKLKVKVHIVFKPATGKPMTKSMSVTVKA